MMEVLPVRSPRRERTIIELLLSAYENGQWNDAALDWVEDRQDGAVEVIATKRDGTTLALEHTLIQPFVGEKFDSKVFMDAFGRIEKNPALVMRERTLHVIIPVHAIPVGYNWEDAGADLLVWLTENHTAASREGESHHIVPVCIRAKKGPLDLPITLRTMHLPGMAGSCLIARKGMPKDLGAIIEKALRTKLPKLVGTPADRRVLLLEREQMALADSQIYAEIVDLAPLFPDLCRVHELWFADTSILGSEGWAYFSLRDGRGLVELLAFEHGILRRRRNDRALLGRALREF